MDYIRGRFYLTGKGDRLEMAYKHQPQRESTWCQKIEHAIGGSLVENGGKGKGERC